MHGCSHWLLVHVTSTNTPARELEGQRIRGSLAHSNEAEWHQPRKFSAPPIERRHPIEMFSDVILVKKTARHKLDQHTSRLLVE
eukprot:scaffold113774_cov32-Tisochrysis_lutea.AAC.2